ncbi:UNVERIFIED_CONTAM: LuxR family two component transcriptional regulator [Acetivibrio alkalicellulosi]
MLEILMVDDHISILSGFKSLLKNYHIHATICNSGTEALELLKNRSFDAMVYDLKMPDMNGLELTKKTLKIYPDAIIVILSGENISDNFDVLMESGVSGILDKSCTDQQLVTGIKMATEKMMLLPVKFVRKLNICKSEIDRNSYSIEQPLTQIESEVLQQAALGKTNKEIAENLQLVQRSVEYHLSSIYKKLNVTSRVYAIKKAFNLNLIKS